MTVEVVSPRQGWRTVASFNLCSSLEPENRAHGEFGLSSPAILPGDPANSLTIGRWHLTHTCNAVSSPHSLSQRNEVSLTRQVALGPSNASCSWSFATLGSGRSLIAVMVVAFVLPPHERLSLHGVPHIVSLRKLFTEPITLLLFRRLSRSSVLMLASSSRPILPKSIPSRSEPTR
jgi:hypothetical protein